MKRIGVSINILNYNNLIIDYSLHEQLNGFIYSLLKLKFPELHENRGIKDFNFSNLISPKAKYNKDGIHISQPRAYLNISSTDDDKINCIIEQLQNKSTIHKISNIDFRILSVYDDSINITGNHIKLRTTTPVCINTKTDDKERYVSLIEEKQLFLDNMKHNIKTKTGCSDIEIIIADKNIQRKSMKYKDGYITGYLFDFEIKCEDANILNTIYYNGVGIKNALGFGFVDLIKK